MQLLELSKALEENKLPFTKLNLEVFKWVYAGAGYQDYNERYGILIHPKTGISAGIPLPNYIGDLGAVLEAIQRLLPHAEWSLHRHKKMFEASFWIDESDDADTEVEYNVIHENPCNALLAGAFKAKHEMMKEYGDEDA